MVIQEDCPVYTPGMDQREVLRMAALAARWREPPRDALDTLVLTQADLPSLCVLTFLLLLFLFRFLFVLLAMYPGADSGVCGQGEARRHRTRANQPAPLRSRRAG